MPVYANPLGSRMQLRLLVGQDEQGNPIFRTRSYANVKPTATDDEVHQVGAAIAGLMRHGLEELRRINEYVLVEV